MRRRARDLHAALQRFLVHAQAIIALAAEGGDQRRMDVDHAVFIRAQRLFAQNAQESGQHHHVDVVGGQDVQQLLVVCLRIRLHHLGQHGGFDARRLRPFQRIGALAVGNHQPDLAVG